MACLNVATTSLEQESQALSPIQVIARDEGEPRCQV